MPLEQLIVESAQPSFGCVACNADLRSLILNHRFWLLLLTVAPGLLLGGFATAWLATRWSRHRADPTLALGVSQVTWAAMLIGLGLGGFADGIVLHQVLQVHEMISNSLPPTSLLAKGANMFWDGVFHLAAWTLTFAGVVSLWRLPGRGDFARSGRLFWGAMLLGWGAFNLLDSVMSHMVFRFHNLVEASDQHWAWNLAFLAFGVAQALLGSWLMRSAIPQAGRSPRTIG